MLPTVEFDSESQLGSMEIQYKRPNRMLPSEICTKLSIAKLLPELHLNVSEMATKAARHSRLEAGAAESRC